MMKTAEYDLAPGYRRCRTLDLRHRLLIHDGTCVRIWHVGSRQAPAIYADRREVMNCPLAVDASGRRVYHASDQVLELDLATGLARAVTSFRGQNRLGVYWQLHCSPSAGFIVFRHEPRSRANRRLHLSRARIVRLDLPAGRLRVLHRRRPGTRRGVWEFDCDWVGNRVLAVQTGGRRETLLAIDLGDGLARRLPVEARRMRHPRVCPMGNLFAFDDVEALVVVRLKDGREMARITGGKSSAWAPTGRRLAFMRGDEELWVARFDASPPRIERLVWPSRPWDRRADGSYAVPPSWSCDGQLLWFRSTRAHRHAKPMDLDFVDQMRRKHGAKSAWFEMYLEASHWQFHHHVGIVDFAERRIWMKRGFWRTVAWLPLDGGETRGFDRAPDMQVGAR